MLQAALGKNYSQENLGPLNAGYEVAAVMSWAIPRLVEVPVTKDASQEVAGSGSQKGRINGKVVIAAQAFMAHRCIECEIVIRGIFARRFKLAGERIAKP